MSLTPLFPLQLVFFPGDKLPLHIFEPRYREMIKECLDSASAFGIVSFIENKVSKVGTFADIEKVEMTYDNGNYDVVCRGGDRFMCHSYNSTRTFLQGSVTKFHDELEQTQHTLDLRNQVLSLFNKMAELAILKPDKSSLAQPENSFGFGHLIGFDLAQKQNLLEIKTERDRLQFIKEQIERLIPKLEAFQDTRDLVKSNGHFRHYPPLDFNID